MKYHRVDGKVVRLDEPTDPSRSLNLGTDMEADDTHAAAITLLAVLEANPPDADDPLKRNLPFQPRSYRDFMLFESHYYGVAMGMSRAYLFPAYLAARAFVFLTGGLLRFPPFRPPKLWHSQAIFYQSNHLAFYADGAAIHYPRDCTYLDVELELGVVLGGKGLYNAASPDEALAAVAGFCVFNDFSARNLQMAEMSSGFGPQHSKGFANSISAAVVSADEVLHRYRLGVTINGQAVARPRPDNWQFSLGEALMQLSRGTRLYPGEFFGSGTFPGGAGIEWSRFEVKVGDTVRLEIEGIGSVTNTIVAEEVVV
ncbi:uncharacterized protein B0I36DRAFT_350178 [Microdochium trichocladiopsis]|uniref:Fumarylacetoacetase-like C-terminal domain-containing protein n=1 Tax=Microdochium trichocladiopsis TaxID=1682393 RepID=A0A9P8Y4N7_9PEZI|nr:uncharacterized protein B0I36DRAFT_350178 [Microdochium trichocladiopsis]KAH7029270.1 hypothetical protein B0I36DRAFT_350178 [Microdochium trichocladiopsis]